MSKSEHNKRSKPDDPSNSPTNDISNNDLARMIEAQGRTTANQIKKLADDLRAEFKEGLTEIKQEIDAMKTNFTHLKFDVGNNTSEITRSKLANDVIISGVPFVGCEDLDQYFVNWCKVLGYTNKTPFVDIRRLTKEPLRDGKQCFILVQFAFPNQRNEFYSKYLRSRNLTLRQIGFQSDDRVYVNENLIPASRSIKAKALSLRKEGKLSSVYSRNGVIFVKAANSDQERPIHTLEQLQEFQNK